MAPGAFGRLPSHHSDAAAISLAARRVTTTRKEGELSGAKVAKDGCGVDNAPLLRLANGLEKERLFLGREVKGLVIVRREHRHRRAFGERLTFDDDPPSDDLARRDSHSGNLPLPAEARDSGSSG